MKHLAKVLAVLALIGLVSGCGKKQTDNAGESTDGTRDGTEFQPSTETTSADTDSDSGPATHIDSETESGTESGRGETSTETGSDGDADVDADTDADIDGDTDTDTDGDGDGDTDTDADGDGDTDTDADADVDGDGDTDRDADVDTDSNGDVDSDTNSDTGGNGDTDTDIGGDTDTQAEPDAGASSDSGGDTETSSRLELTSIALSKHACAATSSGEVYCWGRNLSGEVGVPDAGAPVLQPVRVAGISTGKAVTLGKPSTLGVHSCAVLEDGTVWCWGLNSYGQLGDGATTDRDSPVRVSSLNNIVEVAAGCDHTCARDDKGLIWCWGSNRSLELGDNSLIDRLEPVQVWGLDDAEVEELDVGCIHACVRLSNGTARCWGANAYGEVGTDSPYSQPIAAPVVGLENAVQLALGSHYSCALLETGQVTCWGTNLYGQLGNPEFLEEQSLVPILLPTLSDIVEIASGINHACALKQDGTVLCWGGNHLGQLGGSTSESISYTPLAVPGLEDVIQLGHELGGGGFAVRSDNTILGWGSNEHGQLGLGHTDPVLESVATGFTFAP